MLSDFRQMITVNGNSKINSGIAVLFNATVEEDGKYNVNKVVRDMDLYTAHKTECDWDFTEFDEKVYEIAKGLEK